MTQTVGDMRSARTTADIVFEQLHKEINSLKILPNAKISEADIANRLGVSRQPVRDAFNRLGNLDLLTIRPQRPTIVRGFSMDSIQNARFIRLAVELEVIRTAVAVWDEARAAELEANLDQQRAAIDDQRIDDFHDLDYDFHRLICALSGHSLAFETIERCKQHIDRLCVLSLERADEGTAILAEHEEIARSLRDGAASVAAKMVRRHLSRIDQTIKDIHETHSDYFE